LKPIHSAYGSKNYCTVIYILYWIYTIFYYCIGC